MTTHMIVSYIYISIAYSYRYAIWFNFVILLIIIRFVKSSFMSTCNFVSMQVIHSPYVHCYLQLYDTIHQTPLSNKLIQYANSQLYTYVATQSMYTFCQLCHVSCLMFAILNTFATLFALLKLLAQPLIDTANHKIVIIFF